MNLPANAVATEDTTLTRGRVGDFFQLAKPRITFMVTLTALVGFFMGAGQSHLLALGAALLGTALACAGAGSLNMYLERDIDALMVRTRMRPLPSGRLRPREALRFGLLLSLAGLVIIGLGANLLAASVTLVTIVSYALLYTPLKLRSRSAILVGAFPGALPPVIGWTAATGRLDAGGAALFGLLYLWQIPHFLAIDWLYKDDYRRAGFQTNAVQDPAGGATAWRVIAFGAFLIPVSLTPSFLGMSGILYLGGALLLGLLYFGSGVRLAVHRSRPAARGLLLASVAYLPLVLMLLALDKVSW